MPEVEFLVIGILLLTTILLLWTFRRLGNGQTGQTWALRPLAGYTALRRQLGLAVESGRRPHLTLGRGPLHTISGPTSAAGLKILDLMTDAGSKSTLTPRVTVGTGTLLPAAQDSVRRSYEDAGRGSSFRPGDVEFLADDAFPFTYAAGASYALSQDDTGSNIAVGHFGEEIAIITEAGHRDNLGQVAGTDNPIAMALATAGGAETLWGEELFVAGAYLEGTPLQLASARVQDILRWLLILTRLAAAVWQFLSLL